MAIIKSSTKTKIKTGDTVKVTSTPIDSKEHLSYLGKQGMVLETTKGHFLLKIEGEEIDPGLLWTQENLELINDL